VSPRKLHPFFKQPHPFSYYPPTPQVFLLEANLLRKLKHSNIVKVSGIGASNLSSLDTVRRSMYQVGRQGSLEVGTKRRNPHPPPHPYTHTQPSHKLLYRFVVVPTCACGPDLPFSSHPPLPPLSLSLTHTHTPLLLLLLPPGPGAGGGGGPGGHHRPAGGRGALDLLQPRGCPEVVHQHRGGHAVPTRDSEWPCLPCAPTCMPAFPSTEACPARDHEWPFPCCLLSFPCVLWSPSTTAPIATSHLTSSSSSPHTALFLPAQCKPMIIHRDLKPENVVVTGGLGSRR
jgi:serine/threonine protein kinase